MLLTSVACAQGVHARRGAARRGRQRGPGDECQGRRAAAGALRLQQPHRLRRRAGAHRRAPRAPPAALRRARQAPCGQSSPERGADTETPLRACPLHCKRVSLGIMGTALGFPTLTLCRGWRPAGARRHRPVPAGRAAEPRLPAHGRADVRRARDPLPRAARPARRRAGAPSPCKEAAQQPVRSSGVMKEALPFFANSCFPPPCDTPCSKSLITLSSSTHFHLRTTVVSVKIPRLPARHPMHVVDGCLPTYIGNRTSVLSSCAMTPW
jgi:hypothetical protein